MGWRHARSSRARSGSGHVLLHLDGINGANCISPGPHGSRISRGGGGGCWVGSSHAILASTALSAQVNTTGTLSAVARTRGGGSRLVQLLLVAQ